MKYFVLGAFSSAFFLYGIALVYGATGSTNLADDRRTSGSAARVSPAFADGAPSCSSPASPCCSSASGSRSPPCPFHSWTPDVYQGSPTPVVGLHGVGREGRRLRRAAPGLRR